MLMDAFFPGGVVDDSDESFEDLSSQNLPEVSKSSVESQSRTDALSE